MPMPRHPKKKRAMRLPVIWEFTPHPHVDELLKQVIKLILADANEHNENEEKRHDTSTH